MDWKLRNIMLIGEDASERLKSARVAVVGIRGIDGFAVGGDTLKPIKLWDCNSSKVFTFGYIRAFAQ